MSSEPALNIVERDGDGYRVTLAPQFREPSGWRWATFRNVAGATIRHGAIDPAGPTRATIVGVPGFGGFAEQWFELVRDLTARGYAVRLMDWRGQGGSEHYLANTHKYHAQGYDKDVADLQQFVSEIVQPEGPRPLLLLGHSMGGHLGLRHLATHPGVFRGAFLTAPLLGVKTVKQAPGVVARVARLMNLIGFGRRYIPGHADWFFRPHYTVEDSNLSHDPLRYRVAQLYYQLKPELRIGGATWAWLDHTFRSVAWINRGDVLRRITTPVFIVQAGLDHLVDNRSQDRAVQLMANAELLALPGAKHDILMEADNIRLPLLSAFDRFAARALG
jgi:lysophospholipase